MLLVVGLLAAACDAADQTSAPTSSTRAVDVSTPGEADLTMPDQAPRRDAPPGAMVALTADGRLVVIDTATGREVRELARAGNPLDVPEDAEIPPNVIYEVALAPGGDVVWYSTCCEPASGTTWRVPLDASTAPEQLADGYHPTFATGGRWLAGVDLFGVRVVDTTDDGPVVPDIARSWADERWSGSFQQVAWSPDGTSFAVRVGLPAAGDLLIVSLSDFAYGPTRGDAASHPEPVVVSGSAFAHPTFRRDGSLVVAQRRSDGRWIRHILDVGDLSRPVEGATEYVGTPLGQDHDPSGEWLLAPVDDTGSGVGSVHWFGPNGDAGVIDGEFRAASW